MIIKNPWLEIPLEDYERHMEHASVAQAQLLNFLTKTYLAKYCPEKLLFLGVSGGNGLEHIDENRALDICGIDINELYIKKATQRFANRFKSLRLEVADISVSEASYIKADFIWAALIFEFVGIEKGFEFIGRNSAQSAILAVTIQSNNGSSSISQSGVMSVHSVKDIFRFIDGSELCKKASDFGFDLVSKAENFLPNGKSLMTYEFARV